MKKGQAALEFLMTYGWAFLVIMLMIGALAYFGILSPAKYLPDRCNFGTPLRCQGQQFIINSAGDDTTMDDPTIAARWQNDYGQNVVLKEINISTDYEGVCDDDFGACLDTNNDNSCDSADISGFTTNESILKADKSANIIIECNDGQLLTAGDKVAFDVSAMWYTTASSELYAKPVEGTIYANVQ